MAKRGGMICVCSDTEGFVIIDSVGWMKSSESVRPELAKKFCLVAKRGDAENGGR